MRALQETEHVLERTRAPKLEPEPELEPESKMTEVLPDPNEPDEDIQSWLTSLSGEQPIRVTLARKRPRTFHGVLIEGTCDEYDGPVSVEEIRQQHGGGHYILQVRVPNGRGGWQFYKHVAVKIAGNPKVDMSDAVPVVGDGGNAMVAQAMDAMRSAQERADRAASKTGMDAEMLRLISEPLASVNKDLQRQLDALRREMVSGAGNGNAIDKELLELEHRRQDMALQHLRDEVKRTNERAENECRESVRRHDRELETVRRMHDDRLESQRMMYEGRAEIQKGEVERLRAHVASLEAQVRELSDSASERRSVKDTVQQMMDMREALSPLDREAPASGMLGRMAEKAFDKWVMSPDPAQMKAFLDRWSQEARPPAQQERRPSPSQPPRPQERSAAGAAPQPAAETKARVAQAIQFLETAVTQGTPPRTVASGAKSLLDGATVAELAAHSVDDIIGSPLVSESSPLATQVGRQFLREFLRHLA